MLQMAVSFSFQQIFSKTTELILKQSVFEYLCLSIPSQLEVIRYCPNYQAVFGIVNAQTPKHNILKPASSYLIR